MKYLIIVFSFITANSVNNIEPDESCFDYAVSELLLTEQIVKREFTDEEAYVFLNNVHILCESGRKN